MGLYIPPTGGSDSSSRGNENSTPSPSKSGNADDKFIFYTRPSVGLKIWGPLVPANDYLPGLYALTGIQTIMGALMFRNVRAIWRNTTTFARVSKTLSTIAGSYLIFNSGLEISRLSLPYDPWYDEAKQAREAAVRRGEKPNFWFGPWDYKPMSFSQWNEKVDKWILETEGKLERGDYDNGDSNDTNEYQKSPRYAITSPEFHNVYLQIKEMNKRRSSEILQQLQNGSFKDILPNYQGFVNPRFDRPTITIPKDNELEDDYDLEEVWQLNDPWVSLGYDIDYIIRFIPKFRWIDKIGKNNAHFQEQQETLKAQHDPQQAQKSDKNLQAATTTSSTRLEDTKTV